MREVDYHQTFSVMKSWLESRLTSIRVQKSLEEANNICGSTSSKGAWKRQLVVNGIEGVIIE
jgi:hypothetical protein